MAADKKNGAPKKPGKAGSAAARLKEEKASFKYNVDNLADALGIESASARVALRKAGIKKAGRAYGWNSKDDFEGVVRKLKGAVAKPAKKEAQAEA